MKLQELQHLFWRACRYSPAPPEVDEAFVSFGKLSGRDRMDLYRQMYWYRQVDVMFEEFEHLAKLLGDEFFTRMISKYIQEYPSEAPALEYFGRHLSEFLLTRPREEERRLSDLAKMEWEYSASFLTLNPEKVLSKTDVDPARFAGQKMVLHPSLRVARVSSRTLKLWNTLAHEEEPSEAELKKLMAKGDHQVPVAFSRKGFHVHYHSMTPDETEALAAAQAGKTLGEICTIFALSEQPTQRAFQILLGWFERHWVVGLEDVPATGEEDQ